jgi:predicted dehydrogenase
MCWYAGTPRWVVGEESNGFVRSVHGVEDPGGIGMVRFDNGVIGFVKSSSPSPYQYMSELDLVGTAGRIRITGDGARVSVYRFAESDASPGSGYEILVEQDAAPPDKNERMVDAISDIVQCIENKRQPKSNGYSSLCSLRVIAGIQQSSRDGNCRVDI